MLVREVVTRLDLKVVAGEDQVDRVVTGGYTGDLLSCVMAGAAMGNLWVTVQAHPNVVAVALLVGISAVIITEGARIESAVIEKANREGIPILSSPEPSFEVVVALAGLGIKGKQC
jgi:predicted transcriptional regulator